ncbi:MAG: type II toxin-antitoxin system VapC family toxin [Burkholderiales bacterium]
MTALVVDASVWVSAADATDRFCAASRTFLDALARRRVTIALPAWTRLEVACALARRTRDTERGRLLAEKLLQSPLIAEEALDASLLAEALRHGSKAFLRAGDALYATVTTRGGGDLVSWDDELIRRASAITPEAWLAELG